MRRRLAVGVLSLIAVVSLAVAVARTRTIPSPPTAVAAAPPTPAPAAGPSALPPDTGRLRDIFRFGDEPSRTPDPAPELTQRRTSPAAEPSGPRLVGFVRRSGRLLAALALDGEVELAGVGESAAGVTVLSVSEDAVRVRGADGVEATLQY